MSAQQTLKKINLRENEKNALRELKERILERFPNAEIILYGSKARGDSDEESDIDLLILVESLINTKLEEEIFHISYQIELKYELVFGEIVENKDFWNTPLANAMPLHWNIDREGVHI
ncbi:MAG: nucleotidyltransferase domain-containing protein [Actinobacteria bacterium]|nr:nucleotidyltransferase domain-containing protein [Cyanobacteriota bacterium]MCL5771774.1 nucleotidyltransferase domain-containing protein [Actinomycetota bacterium]